MLCESEVRISPEMGVQLQAEPLSSMYETLGSILSMEQRNRLPLGLC